MLAGKKILIFDSTPLIAVDIEQIAIDLGADSIVMLQANNDDARETMRSEAFDLAIVDHQSMQELTVNIMEELLKQRTAVVMLTTEPDAPDEPVGDGRVAIVEKPYSFDSIKRAIEALER